MDKILHTSYMKIFYVFFVLMSLPAFTDETPVRWMIRRDLPQIIPMEEKHQAPWTEEDYSKSLKGQGHIGLVYEIPDGKGGHLVLGSMVYELKHGEIHVAHLNANPAYAERIYHSFADKLIGKLWSQRRQYVTVLPEALTPKAKEIFQERGFELAPHPFDLEQGQQYQINVVTAETREQFKNDPRTFELRPNLYQRIGLHPYSTQQEIEDRLKLLEKMGFMNRSAFREARSILSSLEKKANYDSRLQNQNEEMTDDLSSNEVHKYFTFTPKAPTLYQRLGTTENASLEKLKDAYIEANLRPNITEKDKQKIKEAYYLLSSTEARRIYDRILKETPEVAHRRVKEILRAMKERKAALSKLAEVEDTSTHYKEPIYTSDNLYQRLGVAENAATENIDDRYLILMRQLTQEMNNLLEKAVQAPNNNSIKDQIKTIKTRATSLSDAWQILGDPTLREKYNDEVAQSHSIYKKDINLRAFIQETIENTNEELFRESERKPERRTLYSRLGVSPNASQEKIEEAYNNLINQPLERSQQGHLNTAYAVLSDIEYRKKYDAFSTSSINPKDNILLNMPWVSEARHKKVTENLQKLIRNEQTTPLHEEEWIKQVYMQIDEMELSNGSVGLISNLAEITMEKLRNNPKPSTWALHSASSLLMRIGKMPLTGSHEAQEMLVEQIAPLLTELKKIETEIYSTQKKSYLQALLNACLRRTPKK